MGSQEAPLDSIHITIDLTRMSFKSSSILLSKLLKPKNGLLSGKKSLLSKRPIKDVHPKTPVRTRFAPSPTGLLHMGSLRTALYNYLLARNTGGQFLLRLEDTDQKRLVPGAEQNIYDSLKWCGVEYDEGPGVNEDKFGPYRQSDRTEIYQHYIKQLLNSGHAYRCFCSKERLDGLRSSAQQLQPPTTASYDRHCTELTEDEIAENLKKGVPCTVRLKAPKKYPPFEDLLHGQLDMQIQINMNDIRYDDPILMKSDGLPTYHFANVVDDHLMRITHVIRGEEWLPSTPKHIALYNAFGWNPPQFIHIPLLTSTNDKKLSKRKGDADVMQLKAKGILPEALVNFSVLFGWSPPRELATMTHECFSLEEFVKLFDLNHLTKGNAKVDAKKLLFFNKHYLSQRLGNKAQFDEIANEIYNLISEAYPDTTIWQVNSVLQAVGKSLTTIYEFNDKFYYFFTKPDYEDNTYVKQFKSTYDLSQVKAVLSLLENNITESNINTLIESIVSQLGVPKKLVFETIRFSLAGSIPGVKLPLLVQLLGVEKSNKRILESYHYLSSQ